MAKIVMTYDLDVVHEFYLVEKIFWSDDELHHAYFDYIGAIEKAEKAFRRVLVKKVGSTVRSTLLRKNIDPDSQWQLYADWNSADDDLTIRILGSKAKGKRLHTTPIEAIDGVPKKGKTKSTGGKSARA